jgi:hypothetical protein
VLGARGGRRLGVFAGSTAAPEHRGDYRAVMLELIAAAGIGRAEQVTRMI